MRRRWSKSVNKVSTYKINAEQQPPSIHCELLGQRARACAYVTIPTSWGRPEAGQARRLPQVGRSAAGRRLGLAGRRRCHLWPVLVVLHNAATLHNAAQRQSQHNLRQARCTAGRSWDAVHGSQAPGGQLPGASLVSCTQRAWCIRRLAAHNSPLPKACKQVMELNPTEPTCTMPAARMTGGSVPRDASQAPLPMRAATMPPAQAGR